MKAVAMRTRELGLRVRAVSYSYTDGSQKALPAKRLKTFFGPHVVQLNLCKATGILKTMRTGLIKRRRLGSLAAARAGPASGRG